MKSNSWETSSVKLTINNSNFSLKNQSSAFFPLLFCFFLKEQPKWRHLNFILECGTVTTIHLMSGFLSVVTTGWHGASLKFK